jgi:hypothetical protein
MAAPTFSEIYRNTIALDARTGSELWRRPGEIYLATDDGVLLSDRDVDADEVRALRLVRIRDGGMVWARTDLHAQRVTAGGPDPARPDLLVTVAPAGAVEILRLADGFRISAGRVIWNVGSPQEGTYTDVFLDGARLYVRVAGRETSALTCVRVGHVPPDLADQRYGRRRGVSLRDAGVRHRSSTASPPTIR